MNRTKRLISLLFVGLASAALFAACGDDEATSCLEDGDCAATEICVAEICETKCTTQAECAEGESCTGGTGDRQYCTADANNTSTNNTSTNNTSTNNTSTNNNTPDPLYFVLIRDTTTGDGCTATTGGEGDPGSDVASVVVEDLEGTVLGYGIAEVYEFGPEENGFAEVLSNLDGTAPDFADMCPEEFSTETVVSMGCGGYFAMRFSDPNGGFVQLDDSMQIRVMEYGANCGGSADDTLEILSCTDTAGVLNEDISSCTAVLGSGSGTVIGEISL